jgi:hypothetical protein
MENAPLVSSLLCFVALVLIMGFVMMSAAIRIVPENKRLDVYRLGRYIGEKGPGLLLLIPVIDRGVLKEVGESSLTRNRTLIGAAAKLRPLSIRMAKCVFQRAKCGTRSARNRSRLVNACASFARFWKWKRMKDNPSPFSIPLIQYRPHAERFVFPKRNPRPPRRGFLCVLSVSQCQACKLIELQNYRTT